MKQKSWQLNRRDMLRGGGVALALPLLNAMRTVKAAETALPKRMLISYFAYGAYMPNGAKRGAGRQTSRITTWSWWPCKAIPAR